MPTHPDLPNLYAALNLEIAAVARYEDHQARTSDPAVHSLLQGLMRNEDGHEKELTKQIERLGGDPEEAFKCAGSDLPGLVNDGEQVPGQKTNLAMLRADIAFEIQAMRTYHSFASVAEDEEVKKLFIELTRAEKGHENGLRFVVKAMVEKTHDVAFFCPICGWSVSYGPGAELGAESRCRMCGAMFALRDVDGDFTLERR